MVENWWKPAWIPLISFFRLGGRFLPSAPIRADHGKDFFEGLASVRLEMERLLESGAVRILPPLAGGILSGLSFCFTGELSSMKRPQAEQKVKDLGGIIKTSGVKGLSYLVTNDPSSGSSKNRKAESLGIPVIGEKEFLALLQDGPSTAGSPAAPQMELNL